MRVFPVWEMHFQKMIESGNWPIATERVKWSTKYQERHGIKTDLAQQLPDGAAEQIQRIAKRVYRTLGLTGYARVDLRMDQAGRDLRASKPTPTRSSPTAKTSPSQPSARGLSYEALLERIMGLGLGWRPGTM